MKAKRRVWKWILVLVLGLAVLPLVSLGLGVLWVTPLRVERGPLPHDEAAVEPHPEAPAPPVTTETPDPTKAGLNPQNRFHLFVVMPLLAALTMLPLGALGGIVWWTWLQPLETKADAYGKNGERDKRATVRYGLLALLFWAALSVLFVLDLLGSASLYPTFLAVYAGFWTLVGGLLLHDRPLREKGLILAVFLIVVFSLRFVNWNSRKPFLRDFHRIEAGMTYPQVAQIMRGYERSLGTETRLDDEGRPVAGAVGYTHTEAAWGDSDIGLLTFQDGRVAEARFLPD